MVKLYPDAAKRYVAESGRIRTPTSAESFLKVVRFCQKQWPEKHVRDFTSQDLTEFCFLNDPADRTIKKRKSHLIALFKWLQYQKLITTNIATDLEFTVQPGNQKRRLGAWLTEPQCRGIIDGFEDTPIGRRDRLVFMIGIMLGLRVHELASLRWDQFNADFSTVRVLGKGRKLVDLPVPSQLQKELLAWSREKPGFAEHVIPGFRWHGTGSDRQLVAFWGKPLHTESLRYICSRASERIGVRFTPHDLRRSGAGILEAKGLSLKDIQGWGRWASIAQLDTYLSQNPARLKKVVDGLSWEF